MKWNKLKHIFVADKHSDWLYSHASNAVFTELNDHVGRVYFSCRDNLGRSHIATIDIDFNDDFKVIGISEEPIVSPGVAGTFDDSGTVMGCLQQVEGTTYLYYLGWNLKVTVPWLNTIGLAIQNPETGKFEKYSQAPMMDRSHEDPFSISYPSIIREGDTYRMWYGSNLSWGETQDEMQHVFKYAESKDAINWKRTNHIAVNLEHKNEYALSKPWVRKLAEGNYEMWYSYRACNEVKTYRIGYATSEDGLNWTRRDNEAGIDVSVSGWDSEAISYPCVFEFMGKTYMIYNGNHYGKAGLGIAVLENEQ